MPRFFINSAWQWWWLHGRLEKKLVSGKKEEKKRWTVSGDDATLSSLTLSFVFEGFYNLSNTELLGLSHSQLSSVTLRAVRMLMGASFTYAFLPAGCVHTTKGLKRRHTQHADWVLTQGNGFLFCLV